MKNSALNSVIYIGLGLLLIALSANLFSDVFNTVGENIEGAMFLNAEMFAPTEESVGGTSQADLQARPFAMDKAKRISLEKLGSRAASEKLVAACTAKGIEAEIVPLDNMLFGEQHVVTKVTIDGKVYYSDPVLGQYDETYLFSEEEKSSFIVNEVK